jgi:hypothetical protein
MTHEEIANELLRMEADMIDLDRIVHETVHNLTRLSEITSRLATSQQQAWDAINTLSKRIDRFIAGQANGHNGEPL